MDGTSSAQALRERNRKTITLPNAEVDIVITKLNAADFIEARGVLDIPTEALIKKTEGEKRAAVATALSDPETLLLYINFILTRGVLQPRVVQPRIVDGQIAELADDEVYASDFGEDREFAVNEIVGFSGYGERAEAVRKFRKAETKEHVDAGPSGEEVREGTT